MTYRFIIYEYHDASYFDIPVKTNINLADFNYIRFSSDKSSKIVFKFYKEKVCKGGKPSSSSLIESLGFFDAGNQDWSDFEYFNKSIIYSFFKKEYDIIELMPYHVGYTFSINKLQILDL